MADTIIKALRDYFIVCPLMEDNKINVDYLPEDTKRDGVEISIDSTPAESIIKNYMDGGAECQYVFVVRTVNDYGSGVLQNIENSGFYEALTAWMQQQTRQRKLPVLASGSQPLWIEALSTGYLFSAFADVAKYQIQCRLVYYKKGDR